jgi:hypothetical protein
MTNAGGFSRPNESASALFGLAIRDSRIAASTTSNVALEPGRAVATLTPANSVETVGTLNRLLSGGIRRKDTWNSQSFDC